MDANTVIAVASSIAAFGVLFVGWQTKIAKESLEADHERTRRIETINVMREWERDIKPESSACVKLISKLEESQCRDIEDSQTLTLERKFFPLASACFKDTIEDNINEGENFTLSEKEVAHLRYLMVGYLNALEIVCMAWQQSIVDKEMIENEFQFLYRQKDGYKANDRFRNAMGGDSVYPAINNFVKKLIINQQPNDEKPDTA